jgi:6-phosphogluconolactonase
VVIPSDRYASAVAQRIAAAIDLAITERDRCSLALTGGVTPIPVYRELAGMRRIRWRHVDIFFGDERMVPRDDPGSNYRMTREALLDRIAIPEENIHPMDPRNPDREQAARDYDALLPARLDILLLGVGADGHTASLFPGSAAIGETVRRVVPVTGPVQPSGRLSITPAVIDRARTVFVLVTGAAKAEVVARAIDGADDPGTLPARLALHGTWLLDDMAAARLLPTGD